MYVKIPFESVIPFKTSIYEITKMSLEHDFNVNDGVVLGNFYVTGEYKAHEVSVNKEEFKYTLPFTVELNNRIKTDSLEFNIEDFSYDILEGNKLKVNIEDFSYDILEGNKLKVNIEYSLEAESLEEEREELFEEVPEEEYKEELEVLEEKEEVKEEEKEERVSAEEEKTIMESISSEDDTYVTYHIHIVKESETYETISTLYNVPTSLIKEYNNLEELSLGDKVLIPQGDE